MKELFLRLDSGEDKGRIYKISSIGMRLGRSSSNDIHVPDEELSRNHCLFEVTAAGELRITDLASANGTRVNGEQIGANTKVLKVGDVIEVGNTALTVIDSDKPQPIELKVPNENATIVKPVKVDLGLAKKPGSSGKDDKNEGESNDRPAWMNYIWFGVAILLAIAGYLLLQIPIEENHNIASIDTNKGEEPQTLKAFEYEKIDADANRIFRYYITIDENAKISLELDDVPTANRHMRKNSKLSKSAMARLIQLVTKQEVIALEREYSGESSMTINELKSYKLSVNIDGVIRDCYIENAPEPEAFHDFREELETFVNNELGIWSIQYPKEKLLEMSFAAYELGESKWDERDVEFGNVAAAIKAFKESIFYLDTVNPKPDWFNKVRENLRIANKDLDNRYKEQLFKVDRAINTSHWDDAATELKLLMQMIPDSEDERHQTAERKLLDITNRLKGARK